MEVPSWPCAPSSAAELCRIPRELPATIAAIENALPCLRTESPPQEFFRKKRERFRRSPRDERLRVSADSMRGLVGVALPRDYVLHPGFLEDVSRYKHTFMRDC